MVNLGLICIVANVLCRRYIVKGNKLAISELLLILGGQTIVITGCISWLGKLLAARIQIKDESLMQKELASMKATFDQKLVKLSAKNDSKVHVGKIQYEREFLAYEKIWETTNLLPHKIKLLSINKADFAEYEKSLELVLNLRTKQADLVSSLFPFIDYTIYLEAFECNKIIQDKINFFENYKCFLLDESCGVNVSEEERQQCEKELEITVEKVSLALINSGSNLAVKIRNRNDSMIVVE